MSAPAAGTMRTVLALILATGAACEDPFAKHSPFGPDARITSASFSRDEDWNCAPCNLMVQLGFVTRLGVAEVRLTGGAGIAFVSEDSTSVIYSSVGGAGGFKGLGESLMRWDAATGMSVRLASEYYVIEQVSPFSPDSGPTLVIISMREFGSGVRHVGIVDPRRGEVFRLERAAITNIDSAGVDVTEWGMSASWNLEALSDHGGLPLAPPARVVRLSLDSLRTMPVIINPFKVWDPDAPDAAPYIVPQPERNQASDSLSTLMPPPPKMPALGSGSVKRIRIKADSGGRPRAKADSGGTAPI